MSKQQNGNGTVATIESKNQIQLFVGFNVGNEMAKALDVRNVKAPRTAMFKDDGTPVLNAKGKQKYRASKDYMDIAVLPATAGEDRPSMAVKTGLVGQDLMVFERDAKREASVAYLTAVTEMLSSGNYNLSRCRLNNKNKVLSSTLKPSKELLLPVITEEQAMKVVAHHLGVTVEQLATMKKANAETVTNQ